jgi:hypothetical protein
MKRLSYVYMYHELFILLYKFSSHGLSELTESSAGRYVYCIMKHTLPSLAIHSFHWHVQNMMIPCCSQELLPVLSVIYFFLTLLQQLFFHPPSLAR